MDEALEALEARGLVQRRSESQVEGDAEFVFKHVLIRDTAYGTLPRASRRQLHAATAAHLERSVPDPDEIGWILAHHWREAGEPSRAIGYLLQAARRTADALAVEETWELYTRALDLAGSDDERRAIRSSVVWRWRSSRTTRAPSVSSVSWSRADRHRQIEALLAQGHSAVWTEDTEATLDDRGHGPWRSRKERRPGAPAGRARAAEREPTGCGATPATWSARSRSATEATETWIPGTRPQHLAEHYHMQADHWYWVGRYDRALEQSHLEFEAAGAGPAQRRVPAARCGHGGPGALGSGSLRGGAHRGGERDRDRDLDGPPRERRHELLHRAVARHLRGGGGARPQLGGRRQAWDRRISTCRGSTRAPT